MSVNKLLTKVGLVISINILLALISLTNADTYSPYPRKLSATFVAAKSASTIDVSAETWPGFTRTFSISLTGIEVPKDASNVKPCQRELAKKALIFIQDYLNGATTVEIHDMTMQTSADRNVEADIHTEKGSIIAALKNHGFARSTDILNEKPWC